MEHHSREYLAKKTSSPKHDYQRPNYGGGDTTFHTTDEKVKKHKKVTITLDPSKLKK